MKIYLVGGAVRDKLLNMPVTEHDYVVVGATEQEMLDLGYQRVGKEFPVYLHPETREEYALARMERKTAPGYKGFAFDTSPKVTLEEDLLRRDLTINAMAEAEDGSLIDYYHGKSDLDQKILRHVSQAFVEDPVRILRVGRFLARYAHLGFTVAPETMELMRHMVQSGEVNALVAERVWKELERALGEKHPEKFFEVLQDCGALSILFPEIDMKGAGMAALKRAVAVTEDPAIRLAVLLHILQDQPIRTLCQRHRLPLANQDLARLTAQHHETMANYKQLTPEALLDIYVKLDYFRRAERFQDFLTAVSIIHPDAHLDKDCLMQCGEAIKAVPAQDIVDAGYQKAEIGEQLKTRRIARITEWMQQKKCLHLKK